MERNPHDTHTFRDNNKKNRSIDVFRYNKKKNPGQTQSNRQFLYNARPSPITQIRNRKRLFIQIEIQKIPIKKKRHPYLGTGGEKEYPEMIIMAVWPIRLQQNNSGGLRSLAIDT